MISRLLAIAGRFPGKLGGWARVAWLRRVAARCGTGVKVLPHSYIGCPERLTIGDDSGIGYGSYLSCTGRVSIGHRVLMGPRVMIYTSNHRWNQHLRTFYRQGEDLAPVTIEDDVWLGAGCIILPGVVISKGTAVAAGSVVTKDTIAYSIVAGVPAKTIAKRLEEG